MTVYQIAGTTLTLEGEGSTNSGNVSVAESINPITGGMGVNTVRITNSSAANVATVTWTPEDVTYSYANVSGTASASGANARFNVTVTNSVYTATLVNAGTGYIGTEQITILGNNLGGTTTANDLTISVATVSNVGGVATFTTSGTTSWPQSTVGEVTVLPHGEDFIQVTNNATIGVYFTGNCADGNIFITPVAIVG